MVAIKFIAPFFLLASSILAAPTELNAREPKKAKPKAPAAATLICGNIALTSKENQVSEDVVKKAWQNAPSKTEQSGYPHNFGDDKIIGALDSACHGKEVLEAPVYTNGKPYPFTTKPKVNPGPFRVIYTDDNDKHYCGLIAHDGVGEVKGTKKNPGTPANPNKGNFHVCTADGPKGKN